jgi:hypothetical protein
MTQDVPIPATASLAFLRFDHATGSTTTTTRANGDQGGYDGGVVEYSTNGGVSYTDLGPLFTVNGYDGQSRGSTIRTTARWRAASVSYRESHGYNLEPGEPVVAAG